MSPPNTSPQPADVLGPEMPAAAGLRVAAGTLVDVRCHLLAGTSHPPHTFERGGVTTSCPGHRNPGEVYVTTVAIQRRGERLAAR